MMEVKDYQFFFSNLSKLILAINTILFFKRFFSRKKVYKIFSFYLLFILTIQIVSFAFWYLKKDNLYLSHFYFIIQFIILSLFYINLFNSKKQKKLVKTISLSVLFILAIQYINTPDLYYKFNLLEIVLTSLSLVSFSVIHFYNSLTEKMEFTNVNSGIFIYLISSTLIFCSGNFTNAYDSSLDKILWLFNSILFVVYQILIFMEWYKNYRKT